MELASIFAGKKNQYDVKNKLVCINTIVRIGQVCELYALGYGLLTKLNGMIFAQRT